MGVLTCDRNGCENIMCDMYSSEHGYICDECFEELAHKPYTDIYRFMRSPKVNCLDGGGAYWVEIIEKEFKNRFDEE